MKDQIRALWTEHVASPFPDSFRGKEVDGVDLVLLDADIAGCVSIFLGSHSALDAQRLRILRELLTEVERVTDLLEEAAEREYYSRLASLARLVLGECTS